MHLCPMTVMILGPLSFSLEIKIMIQRIGDDESYCVNLFRAFTYKNGGL